MAQMIPESVPSGRPSGERKVFDVLQNLPDDYWGRSSIVDTEWIPATAKQA